MSKQTPYHDASFLSLIDAAYTFQLADLAAIPWLPAHIRRHICAVSARRIREFGGYADLAKMADDDALGRELSADPTTLSPERRNWHRALREKRRSDYAAIVQAEGVRGAE